MYSPTLGRFMQTDPIGYADGMNWYAYVGNDPVNAVDPLGLCTTSSSGNKICVVARRVSGQGGITVGSGGKYFGAAVSGDPDFGPANEPKVNRPEGAPQSVACPVGQPAVITAPFGERRGGSIHTGVDLRARMGAPIFAPFQGTVRRVFSGGRGGDSILISNADGSVSGFAHTGAVAGLREGQTVQAGQQIGVSNGSGTGAPHLHLTHRVTADSPKSDPLATAIGGACNATPK